LCAEIHAQVYDAHPRATSGPIRTPLWRSAGTDVTLDPAMGRRPARFQVSIASSESIIPRSATPCSPCSQHHH
jgi:hypothetical protein